MAVWTLATVLAVLTSLLPTIWLRNAPPSVASYGGESDVIGSLVLAVLQYVCLIRLARIEYRRAAIWLGAALAQLVIGLFYVALEIAFPQISSKICGCESDRPQSRSSFLLWPSNRTCRSQSSEELRPWSSSRTCLG